MEPPEDFIPEDLDEQQAEPESCPVCHGQGRFSRRGCTECGEYQEAE
jgi:DnaJ-class molecular chaperone